MTGYVSGAATYCSRRLTSLEIHHSSAIAVSPIDLSDDEPPRRLCSRHSSSGWPSTITNCPGSSPRSHHNSPLVARQTSDSAVSSRLSGITGPHTGPRAVLVMVTFPTPTTPDPGESDRPCRAAPQSSQSNWGRQGPTGAPPRRDGTPPRSA